MQSSTRSTLGRPGVDKEAEPGLIFNRTGQLNGVTLNLRFGFKGQARLEVQQLRRTAQASNGHRRTVYKTCRTVYETYRATTVGVSSAAAADGMAGRKLVAAEGSCAHDLSSASSAVNV